MIRLILASLRYHGRVNAAVALGVAVAVAVLTGALLVGDSMRGSLRDLALDRLGRVDFVLQNGRFFREVLADELATSQGFENDFGQAVPVILLRASLTNPNDDQTDLGQRIRANRVNLIGCDEPFWKLGEVKLLTKGATAGLPNSAMASNELGKSLHGRQIVLNGPLAKQLEVSVGDTVIVRLARLGTIPAESPLGRRDAPESLRLRVGAIIEPAGLGAFGLNPSQRSPRNAYIALETLQERLDRPGQVNTILVAGRTAAAAPSNEAQQRLASMLHPRLSDYGLHVARSPRGYLTLSTDRLLFSRSDESVLQRVLNQVDTNSTVQPALTYLANTIACGKREVPYSTITAIDFAAEKPLGPVLDQNGKPVGPLGPHDIVLNSWAADRLDAKVGDAIRITYFEPESLHGRLRETTESFRLAAIVPLDEATSDPDLLPPLPGVTDQKAMDDWDPPFPFDAERIRPEDEAYWDRYRGTPKAFVTLNAGRRLWASRFGRTTTLRVPEIGPALRYGPGTHEKANSSSAASSSVTRYTPPSRSGLGLMRNSSIGNSTGKSDQTFETLLASRLSAHEMGLVFMPVKQQSLAASAGTTSFNMLFIGFSFFIITSAVLLVVLLFRLGVELRARQVGTLLAVGWAPSKVARLLAAEGAVVALLGSLAGTALGVGYAAIMLLGLVTWWLSAIGSPFLRLHVTTSSLVTGPLVGFAMSLAAILLSLRHVTAKSPRCLMAGPSANDWSSVKHTSQNIKKHRKGPLLLAVVVLLAAAGLALLFARLGDEFQAGAFFGAGAVVLIGLLAAVGWQLTTGSRLATIRPGRGNVARLAAAGAARHPLRSTLSVALVASACFLIVSVSAFRVEPTGQPLALDSANGHFALVGQSDLPIHTDPATREGRRELGFSDRDNGLLDNCTIISFRVRSGDDASCLNLYRPRQPRILGVPPKMIARGGFPWAASTDKANPWKVLAPSTTDNLLEDISEPHNGCLGHSAAVAQNPEKPGPRRARSRAPNTISPVLKRTRVPMVLERDTAVYSLHMSGGLGSTFEVEDDGRPVVLEVAGLLKGSPFQGELLIAEEELLRHWPEVSGYRFFLIDCPAEQTADVRAALERTLGDYGFAAEPMEKYLASFLAVPNTYLSTFQSLGGLGLLLGTFGLAVVQLRNVVERRRELAVLRAVGLRRGQIAWLVMAENGFLLLAGLACGVAAASVAVLPHFLSGEASVPFASLAVTLVLVLLVGLAASGLAVRAAVAVPLLTALREE